MVALEPKNFVGPTKLHHRTPKALGKAKIEEKKEKQKSQKGGLEPRPPFYFF